MLLLLPQTYADAADSRVRAIMLTSPSVTSFLTTIHCQDNSTFEWEELTEKLAGTPPPPRLDHSAVIYPITPNSDTFDKLLIMGGRDLN